jgi:hypothetical protein
MPVFGKTTVAEATKLQKFKLAQVIDYTDYGFIKDAWLGRNGKLYYAGSLDKGHDASCKLLGYASIEACEHAGYIHISSCIRNKITFAAIPNHISKAQYETLYDYCAAHNIKMPV